MSSPGASPAPSSPPSPPNATAPPPDVSAPPPAVSAPPPVATPPPPVPSPPAPVVTPPPATSPPAPVTPATPPPAESPPSPPSSSPSPPSPPSSTPSPPSSTPSPPSQSSPPPPSGGRSPPPPRSSNTPAPATPSSNGGGGGSSSVSTSMVVGIAIAAVAVLAIVSFIFICCRKKKRRSHAPIDYLGPPSGPKVDPYGGQGYQWQTHAPPSGDVHVSMPPKINPPPGGASRPPHSPYMSSGGSNQSGSGNPLPPPSPAGMAYGFAKSMFTYEELAMATDGFSDANLLGQGGFGYVHRGVLPPKEGGTEVAIKQLKAGSGQGEREFQAEVDIISRVHHKHLVTLVGYCMTGHQRLLVYEFVPNNTLEFHLHGKGRPPLDWPTRLRIALGSAKGLAYLHEDCHPKIIHRDIKAANILIDYSFEAKVADFGLAKLTSDVNTHVSTRVMGTFGYLAPEYAASGKLTDKSDVFSFGVVLLEMITGRRPVDAANGMDDSLVDWARPLLTRALDDENFSSLVDPRLQNNYNKSEMARMVACAAACVRHSARRRPRMSQVVRALEGDVSLADLNEGIRPGHSSVYSSHESSDYDNAQYQEDMKKMRRTALADSSEYGATSEYGLNPSGSSSEAATTRELDMGKMKKDNYSQ